MKFSFKSVNSKIDSFLEKSLKIKSSKFRLSVIIVLYLAAIIGLFGVLPFIIGIYLILLVLDEIEHHSTKIAISAIVLIFTLLIGVPWALATYTPSDTQTKSDTSTTTSVVPTQTATQTVAPTPEPTKVETATPEPTKSKVKTVIPKTPIATTPVPGTPEQVAVQPECDPNYSGACVPVASDVDCAGGSGNGPAYIKGPVTVIGRDIYDLDRDGNGIGCEN